MGPVIQANWRPTFEDALRSGGLLYFNSINTSVRTELADSMVTLGEPLPAGFISQRKLPSASSSGKLDFTLVETIKRSNFPPLKCPLVKNGVNGNCMMRGIGVHLCIFKQLSVIQNQK